MAKSDLGIQRLLQLFWDPELRNDEPGSPPIFCLGRQYESHALTIADQHASKQSLTVAADQDQSYTSKASDQQLAYSWPEPFLHDFETRFWFTYRTDFPPIPRSQNPAASAALTFAVRLRNITETNGFTSDSGWGCMIRSGQCLLANALALSRFGRDWRRGQLLEEEKRLIALFADDARSPFSIHRFVEHGEAHCGVHPGEWFGPSATAQCIKALSQAPRAEGIRVYIAEDGAQIFQGSVESLALSDATSFQPVLLLAGVRLGIDRITPLYQGPLKEIFKMKQFVGIAGGQPSSSYYFFAAQGDHLFYLDPHRAKQALVYREDPQEYMEEEVASLHTRHLRKLRVDKMDPSMLLAFLIKDASDFDDFKTATGGANSQIVTIVAGEPPGENHQERDSAVDEVEVFDESDVDESNHQGGSLENRHEDY